MTDGPAAEVAKLQEVEEASQGGKEITGSCTSAAEASKYSHFR